MKLTSVFARNLRLLRQHARLTQYELAERAGTDRNYIGKLEREENSPTLDRLERIAAALQTDAEALLQRDPPDGLRPR